MSKSDLSKWYASLGRRSAKKKTPEERRAAAQKAARARWAKRSAE